MGETRTAPPRPDARQQHTAQAERAMGQIALVRQKNELAELKFDSQGGSLFVPKDAGQLVQLAEVMSQTGEMIRDFYRGNVGNCLALIAVCSPYKLNPITTSWHTYKAASNQNAPISYEAKVIVAMLNQSGILRGPLRFRYDGEGKELVCTAIGRFRDDPDGEPYEYETPPLGSIHPQNSPLWKTDPRQQLAYYAGRAWVRRYKPEMMLGIVSVDEELPAVGPDNARDITPKPKPGRAVYVDEAPDEPPHDEDGVIPDDTSDAEIVETDEQRAARELHETADAKAGEGVIAFREWWGTLDPTARSEVAKRSVAYKEKAEAADAAKAPTDPFADTANSAPDEGEVSGRQVNFATILRAIQHEMIGGNVAEDVRGMYQEELAAMEKQRPDLYAEAEKALAGAAA